MSVRVRALVAVALPRRRLHDRFSRAHRRRRASAARGDRAVAGTVPADRWRAVLIAGDNSSPAFDNGVETLRDKLAGTRRARHQRLFDLRPGASPSLEVATAANVSSALRSGGGEACLVFITSHGDESGFFLRRRPTACFSRPTLDQRAERGLRRACRPS